MPYHTSQQPFLFAVLPASTSTPVMNTQRQSFGSIASSSVSSVSIASSSSGSISTYMTHNGGHPFYNLSKDSNKSNLDLTRPYHPYPTLQSNLGYTNLNISQHNTSGHSLYSSRSYTNSSLSLVPSQISKEKVNHAFGSLPPPCPSNFISASSSSLPLAASVNTPITTPASNTTKALSSASSAALSSRHRSSTLSSAQEQLQQAQYHHGHHHHHYAKTSKTSKTASHQSTKDLSLAATGPILVSSPHHPGNASSLRTLLLPPVASIAALPSRKRISSVIPPLNTKTLPKVTSLSPSYLSSQSTMMSATSPSSAGCLSIAGGKTYSEFSSSCGSTPSTPTHATPFASMSITELIISEAHYLAGINRVANALSQADDRSLAAGLKDSATVRSLMERWSDLIEMHTKFHDDIATVNEDLREAAGLLNSLLVTLEPILLDHGRDLAASLKKLVRRDQNSEHKFAEWDNALRLPLEHLSTYEEWLLRIDPESKFCKDYSSHLNGLIYRVKSVTEANQHPRSVLRRLSTMARGVITKRRSSVQLLGPSFSLSNPQTPTTPTTPLTSKSCDNAVASKRKSQSAERRCTVAQQMEEAVLALAMAETTVDDKEKDLPQVPPTYTERDTALEPSTPIADTFIGFPMMSAAKQLPSETSIAGLTSSGTLAVAKASAVSSPAVPAYIKTSPTAEELKQSSLEREKFISEKEARKATLRVGASESIQARAENLQSPSYKPRRHSADSQKRGSPTRTEAEKPPVRSLISFWEQVSDPLEA
ncbi:hypothetical protein KVV02_007126 [Mortierella alpina]|uniref:DH domain-containing protein n=1 Tax=Mortierella alpina TaxID=64518 RepID=A0A9P8IHM0_MORAP|nr:hypothetical protein KVV02_007126 [Mortierella alpina]